MVGGAVLNQEYADMIGADFMEKTLCSQSIMHSNCLENKSFVRRERNRLQQMNHRYTEKEK